MFSNDRPLRFGLLQVSLLLVHEDQKASIYALAIVKERRTEHASMEPWSGQVKLIPQHSSAILVIDIAADMIKIQTSFGEKRTV